MVCVWCDFTPYEIYIFDLIYAFRTVPYLHLFIPLIMRYAQFLLSFTLHYYIPHCFPFNSSFFITLPFSFSFHFSHYSFHSFYYFGLIIMKHVHSSPSYFSLLIAFIRHNSSILYLFLAFSMTRSLLRTISHYWYTSYSTTVPPYTSFFLYRF